MTRYRSEVYMQMHELEKVICFRFRRIGNLADAMCVNRLDEQNSKKNNYSNSSMATLGDTVLKFLITEKLFHEGMNKGEITGRKQPMESNGRFRSIVEGMRIYKFAFNDCYFFDEAPAHKRLPGGEHDDYLEAIVAAVYLDSGMDKCRKWFKDFLYPMVKDKKEVL